MHHMPKPIARTVSQEVENLKTVPVPMPAFELCSPPSPVQRKFLAEGLLTRHGNTGGIRFPVFHRGVG